MTGRVVALLRHGETPFHSENRYAGQSDLPLNDTGRAQAARLAEWGATAKIASVWASDLSRSVDTAQGVAAASGLVLNTDARFRELDFGIGDGLTAAEMRERFPAERAAFERNPEDFPLPGGERAATAVARAKAALADAIEESAGASGIVVVIAHSTLLRLLTLDLIGVPLARYRAVFPKIEPGSGIILRTDGLTGGILAVNAQLSPGFHLEGY